MKEFLGYEWSAAKGNEGIKYLGGIQLDELEGENEDEGNIALEEEDKRVLSNIFNLDNINTPLYDPNDKNNTGKINHLINQNFQGGNIDIPEELKEHVTLSRLSDMLDFTKIDFNKSISLTPKSTVNFKTKWDTKKLSDIALVNPSKTEIKKLNDSMKVSFVEMASVSEEGYISKKEEKTYQELKKGSYTYFAENDIILAKITPCMENGKCAIAKDLTNKIGFGSSEFHVIRVGTEILNKYLFELLNQEEVRLIAEKNMTGSSGHRRVPKEFYESLKIPLPPSKMQEEIVETCENIDREAEKAKEEIEKETEKIKNVYSELYNSNLPLKSIDSLSLNIQYGINESMNTHNKGFKIFRMNEIIQGYMNDNGSMKYADIDQEKFDKYKLSKGDILFNRTNSIEHVGKTGLFNLDGDYCYASYLIRIETNRKKAIPEYVNYLMNSEQFQTYAKSQAAKSINQANINATKMKAIEIPIPDKLADQKKHVVKLLTCENKINASQEIINGIAKRKEAVIKSYLMGKASEPELAMAAEPKADYKKK